MLSLATILAIKNINTEVCVREDFGKYFFEIFYNEGGKNRPLLSSGLIYYNLEEAENEGFRIRNEIKELDLDMLFSGNQYCSLYRPRRSTFLN